MYRLLVALALLSTALLCWFLIPREEQPTRPAPTEVVHKGNESDKHKKRREWFEKIHRAAPGVDWRQIEQQNWDRHLRTRNRLAKDGHIETRHWREVGSSNQAGRTHATVLSPDKKTIYAGTNLGGMWRADLANAPDLGHLYWEPISDGIYGGAFHVAELADGTLLKATDDTYHYSRDKGLTWQKSVGLGFARVNRGRLRILGSEPDDQTVFAIASKTTRGQETSVLYRSLSNGEFFGSIRTIDDSGDIWTDRTKEGPLYLLGEGKLEISHDRGDTWDVVGTLPEGATGFSVLAGSEAGAPTFYAAISQDGSEWQVYVSKDGGMTWETGATFTDFWGDRHSFEASITNPDLLLHGGVEVFRSTDAGMSFENVHRWWWYYDNPDEYLHADIPGFDFHLIDGEEVLFINTDGGTFYSTDGAQTVNNAMLFGMNVNQFYDVLTDKNDPYRILAGAQDQGYQFANTGDGISKFDQPISGDYGHLVSSSGTHDVVFSNYPGFTLISLANGDTNDLLCCNMDFPEEGDFNWIPHMVTHPGDPWKAYISGDRLWELAVSASQDDSGAWRWSWNHTPVHDFGEYVTAMDIARSDHQRWYAVTENGSFHRSNDGGQTWETILEQLPGESWLYGNAIWIDPDNADRVIVAGSGYSSPSVVISKNGGTSFEELGDDSPNTLVYEIKPGPMGSNDFYVAGQSGPYRYVGDTDTWVSLLGDEAPMTSYHSVETVGDFMRFATYGRGIWDYFPDGVPALNRRYVPHVTPTGDFETSIIISDTTNAGGSLRLQPYDSDGNALTFRDVKVTNGYMKKTAAELFGGEAVSHFSIDGSDNLIVTAAYRATGNAAGGIAHVNQTDKMGQTFDLFQGEWDTIWDGMALVNMGDSETQVVGIRLNADGTEASRKTIFESLKPGAKGLLNFQSLFGDAPDELLRVETTQPAVVTFLRGSLGGTSYLYQTEPVGRQEGDTTRWVPHITRFVEDGGFRTVIKATSAARANETITLTPYAEDGSALTERTLVVPAGGFASVEAETLFEGEAVSHFSIAGNATVVVSYRVAPGLPGGSAHVNETATAANRYAIYPGTWDKTWDGLAVINPGGEPVKVDAVQYDVTGEETKRVTLHEALSPKAKGLLNFQSQLTENPDERVVIEADQPVTVVFLRGPLGSEVSYLYQTAPFKAPEN